MIPKECKRLAEVDFPIAEVSRHAAREKSIRHGHPSTLHLWWARLDDVAYSYQWLADNADIAGATGKTYTPVAADQGTTITVRVTFDDDANNEESLTSAATASVAAASVPADVQEAPAFAERGYVFALAENTDGSTNQVSLGTVSATDPEGASPTYNIEGGNASGLFEIDAASGELFYTGAGEDFEAGAGPFELTVQASDGDLATHTIVAVTVRDVQETPAFAERGYAFDLEENSDGSATRVSLGTVSPSVTSLSASNLSEVKLSVPSAQKLNQIARLVEASENAYAATLKAARIGRAAIRDSIIGEVQSDPLDLYT